MPAGLPATPWIRPLAPTGHAGIDDLSNGDTTLSRTGMGQAGERAGWRRSGAATPFIAAILIASAAVIAVASIGGPGAVLHALEQSTAWIRANQGAALAVLAVWAFASQLAPMPSGTLTMLAAGFLFGWPAALIYFAAMAVAGQIVHAGIRAGLADAPDRWIGALQRRWPRSGVTSWTAAARREGVLVTTALRSLPFLPSAAAAIAAAGLGVSPRDFLFGTLLAGWIRPLAVVSIGSTLSSLAEATGPIDLSATAGGIAIIAVALIAPGVAAVRCFRRPKDSHA